MVDYNDKQKQIVSTAEQLFAQNGFDGTSVRDIAEAAGINIAMISYYFGSKEKLMEALFHQRTANIKLTVEALLHDTSLSPLQKLEALVDDFIDRTLDKHQFFKIMICEQVINKNPVIIQLLEEMKSKNIDEIKKLIIHGQQEGVFKKDIDVLLLMGTLMGCITQMIIGNKIYKQANHLDKLPVEESDKIVKERLSQHIKFLFKAQLLTNG